MPRIRLAAVAVTIVALAAPAAASAQTPAVSKPQLPASVQGHDIQQLMLALAQQRSVDARAGHEGPGRHDPGEQPEGRGAAAGARQDRLQSGRTTAIKQQIAALNNTAQLDMIKLQSMVAKQNQAFEMMSNLQQKMAATKDAIIGNIR